MTPAAVTGGAGAGVPVSTDTVLRTSFHSIATWLNSKEADSTSEVASGPQDMDTDSAAAEPHSNGHAQGSADSADQNAAQDQIIKKVMQELVFHSRAEVRKLMMHLHNYASALCLTAHLLLL